MLFIKTLMFGKSIKSLALIKKIILLLSILGLFVHAGCTTTSFDKLSTDYMQAAYDSENRLEVINGKYKLSPPDVIEVVVGDNPELTTRSIIRPDGNVFIPLVGDIYVEGLSSSQVRKKLHKMLGRYIKELPEESISVQVLGFHSKMVYVQSYGTGLVSVPFTGDLTVLDVVTQSALLTNTSNQRKISIIRGQRDSTKTPQRLVVNLNDIVRKGKMEKNIVLKPDDVVYIPPTILGRIGLAVQKVLFPVQPIQEIGTAAYSAQYNTLGFGGPRLGTTDTSRRYGGE